MNDRTYMTMAINLAKGAIGQTSPNPVVGAVIVKNNEILGMGAHLKAGEPHAEVHAIRMAGEKTNGATMYVTLEPCSHHGKTPPCADLVIQSGIKKVFVGTTDPNPLVAGRGIEKLKKAGIEVELGLMQQEAAEINKVFFHYIRTGLPYVTLKTAMSLDGKTATVTGESQWISGAESREDVHLYRHQHDAILVGINTVLKDDPSLTTRLSSGGKNPVRVILDTNLRIPIQAKIVNDEQSASWIITGSNIDEQKRKILLEKGVKVLSTGEPTIPISKLLRLLGEHGLTSLYVEGGSGVHGSFLTEKAFQQLIVYLAPKLIGGKGAPTSFGGEGITSISEALALNIKDISKIGQDIRIIAEPLKEGEE